MAKVPPRNPNYSAADLWPPGSQGVEFPPAAFHPVYLGNFLCQQYSELVPRVQQYFASKGLLVRMVFSRGADTDPFRAYQDKTKLYDCLVYFTRPEDAQDAIKYLHRDKYFGHRLNIFPGRERLYFEADKSVEVRELPDLPKDSPLDCFVEAIEKMTSLAVVCCTRNTPEYILVEFSSQEDLLRARQIGNEDKTYFATVSTNVRKQRFVEEDVKSKIKRGRKIAKLPNLRLLRALAEGRKIDPTLLEGSLYKHENPALVEEALGRIRQLVRERKLDVQLHSSMFPDAEKQLDAIIEAARGDLNAETFLARYRAPWQVDQKQLTPWEELHVQLHNEGLQYLRHLVNGIFYRN